MHVPSRLERLVRSRAARIALAITLIALSAWVFLPYVGYRIGTSAFVNAELMRINAPIAGKLTVSIPPKGQYFEASRTLSFVESFALDRRHLMDLDRQYTIARDRSELARRQLAQLDTFDLELTARIKSYHEGSIQRLTHELAEADAERTGCLAEVRQRSEVGARMEELVKGGLASRIRTAEANATQESAATRCQMAQARLLRVQTELASARTGISLRDGANDVPYSQQQRDRVVLRRQELELEALQEHSRSEQLAAEIKEERQRVERLGQFTVSLPAHHLVWSVAASPGSAVTEGQTLMDLADCQHRFVSVELPEREFERVAAGDAVALRLIGSTEWKRGQVRQVRGSAARGDDRLLAAHVPTLNPNSIAVEIQLPPEDSGVTPNTFCDIGRLAEVRFQRPFFAWVGSISNLLERLAGGRSSEGSPRPLASN